MSLPKSTLTTAEFMYACMMHAHIFCNGTGNIPQESLTSQSRFNETELLEGEYRYVPENVAESLSHSRGNCVSGTSHNTRCRPSKGRRCIPDVDI